MDRTSGLIPMETAHERGAITARQVDLWFKDSFRGGPWPDQAACERAARELESVRTAFAAKPAHAALAAKPAHAKGPKTNAARRAAIDLLAALPERRRFWEGAKPFSPTGGASDKLVADAEQALITLDAALKGAMPYLDFPPFAVTKHRRTPQQGAICYIAVAVARALYSAGWRALSIEEAAPLVDFITHALEGMDQTVPSHKGIALALYRTPRIRLLKKEMAGPQVKNDG